jgi:MbtH protein
MNPFDREDTPFLVLANAEEQHCLWPGATAVPDGWRTVHGPAERAACLAYVTRHWTDQRPRGVAERIDALA